MKRKMMIAMTVLFAVILGVCHAGAQSPVHWSVSSKMTSRTEGVVTLTATIDKGWHVYGFNQSEDGPVSTTIKFEGTKGVTFIGSTNAKPKPVYVMEEMFGCKVSYWENKVTLTRKFKLTGVKTGSATITINYMCCNETSCRPPSTETLTVKLK